ncbi:MAG: helicase C-terminal domain-containing protein [Nanobdellota archaeon]
MTDKKSQYLENIKKKINQMKELKTSDNDKKNKNVNYEEEVLENNDKAQEKRETYQNKLLEEWIEKKKNLIKEAKKNERLDDIFKINTLFPYENIRLSQKNLIEDINRTFNNNSNHLANAPTGLGKTVASIGPALDYAIRAKKVVFFLTSRQTQHTMAIKTLKDINKKFNLKLNILDIIGKKSMCVQEGVENLFGNDFFDFCKRAKKEGTCEFYNNTRKKNGILKVDAEVFIETIRNKILDTEEMVKTCRSNSLCPYEIALEKSETANVVISDYSYIFHPDINKIFFQRMGLSMEDAIIIVDEAHNLPSRIKDYASSKVTDYAIRMAIKEAGKYSLFEAEEYLRKILHKIESIELGEKTKFRDSSEKITKEDINSAFENEADLDYAISILQGASETVHDNQKRSSISGILNFLVMWQGSEEGFLRMASIDEKQNKEIRYICLDPSLITNNIFKKCCSSVLISGTLEPTFMYRDLLGIDDCTQKNYPNPFPKNNSLHIIVPKTTTQYKRRSEDEFRKIAQECNNIINKMGGNTAIFFPSYYIRDRVYNFLYNMNEGFEFVLEEKGMSKKEKSGVLTSFSSESLKPKVLLGSSSGSFGEGIDLPGNFLTCVIIAGLPLLKPTLEVQELIKYYDKKYNKGWDYGYFYPSFNTTFQNAGRCIRTEKDKGVIIYLDERFSMTRYKKYFGARKYLVSEDYGDLIDNFNEK